MLNNQTQIQITYNEKQLSDLDVEWILQELSQNGYCLLRGYQPTVESFSELINKLCGTVTYDPARALSHDSVQKVDAGVDAIGLHIENGNTPRVPNILGFFCNKAARLGSQTTLCDGVELLDALSQEIKKLFVNPITVSRNLSKQQWTSYIAQEHPDLKGADQVTHRHLHEMLSLYPGHSAEINTDGSINYELNVDAIRTSPLCDKPAFANAILGPSFNYNTPQYRLSNNKSVTSALSNQLEVLAEECTQEINWQDGDILLIDNWRVMHGRRAIKDAVRRELYIGMGML